MRFSVIGTTQVFQQDGAPVPLGGARLRALLTVLAMSPGRAVPVGRIVEEVWAGDPPADAPGAVQALVGRLRRALGRDAVASADGGGYRLCAGADAVDLHRFDRLAGQGGRALEQGDPERAAALLDEALALWRGPVLADLPDRTARAARWESRRLEARRTRLAAALALGRADDALPELTSLCADHPIDESLQALRLRALAATGRPAEALAGYDAFRRRLADRLGADPGPALRAVHRELLDAGRQDCEARPGHADAARSQHGEHPTRSQHGEHPAHPGHGEPLALPGHGAPASPGPGAPASAAPAAPAPSGPGIPGPGATPPGAPAPAPTPPGPGAQPPAPKPRGNLRARLTSFVGREADIETLRQDLVDARLVTLLGTGGAGKTRLAQEAGERVADLAPDGVWLAELAPVEDPEDVPDAVLIALGAREIRLRGAGSEELRAPERDGDGLLRLVEHCGRRRMLLVLDNCEHVVGAAAALAQRLLEECPRLTVLATSREPLGVPGEVLRPVGPLPAPNALRLLADRGAAARPGFTPGDDPDACAEICRRLDGLPLALELAAARLRMLTPRQIADRLDDRFRLLTGGSRTVLPRQQTLRAVVDWSWDLLDTPEHTVLRRLSVFAGGCDLAAAEDVCTDGAADVADLVGVLGALVDKSLVVAEPDGPDGMRYRLLETVAEYAAERLDEAGERPAAERRHLVHYRELARRTDPLLRGRRQYTAIRLFEREYENLRTALRHAVAAGDEQEGLHLVLSLAWYWQMRDLRTEARHWANAVGDLGPDPFLPPYTPAEPLLERFGDAPPPMSPEVLLEARRGVALIRMVFNSHHFEDWALEENRARLHGITEVYRPGLPQVCRHPGTLWFFAVLMTGDMERLKEMLDGTVRTCEEYGYEWELAGALHVRANVLAHRSHWASGAAQDADAALKIFRRIGDDWGMAEALAARGEAREWSGQYELAAADFVAAAEYARRIGAGFQIAVLRARLGGVLVEQGEGERGEAVLREVLADQDGSANEATAIARVYLVLRLGRSGRRDEARTHIEVLKEQFRASALMLFDGMVSGYLAWLDLADGRHRQALDQARDALAKARDSLCLMVAPHLAPAILAMAAGALAEGWPERAAQAARLLGAADVHRPEGQYIALHEREIREHAEKAARAALGDEAYERAYAEGDGLTLEEAAALV